MDWKKNLMKMKSPKVPLNTLGQGSVVKQFLLTIEFYHISIDFSIGRSKIFEQQ